MSQAIYYVAMSLDGYIADAKGGVEWLENMPQPSEDMGYESFYNSVGAVVMGSTTYEQILGFGEYPYVGVESVVITSRALTQPEGHTIQFRSGDLREIINDLKSRHDKNIWIVGGGVLAAAIADLGMIDLYDISVMPIMLRAGIPLLAPSKTGSHPRNLKLVQQQAYDNGVTRLQYSIT